MAMVSQKRIPFRKPLGTNLLRFDPEEYLEWEKANSFKWPLRYSSKINEMIPREELTRICDRAKEELLALVANNETAAEPAPIVPEWLTALQLAEHWQLRNSRGQVTTAGILKWAKRKPEDFPLPHAYMGDLIRFHRTEVDQWAREEADRRRVRKNKTPAQQTDCGSDDKLRPTLTAVGY